MKHIIKKQFIELTLDKQLDHFRLQQLVSQHYWDHIVPILQKEFDKISSEDEIIQIDRLEIDLGIISERSIGKNEWTIGLISKLEEELYKSINTGYHSKKPARISKSLGVFGQWIFYMQKGYLPWNTEQIDDQWYRSVLETLATDFESVLLLQQQIQSDFFVLKRIVGQHREAFLLKLVEIFTAAKQDYLIETINELVILSMYLKKGAASLSIRTSEIKSALWMRTIMLASAQVRSGTKRKLDEQMISLFLQENKIERKLPPKLSSQLKTILPLMEKIIAPIQEDRIGERITKMEKQAADIPRKITIEEEGIFVANAGLVLLHPFLNRLFSRLEFVGKGEFVDIHAQQMAIYVLHYLATGRTESGEHELVIAKILCSYPLEEPVEHSINIPENVLKEADDMMQAAIDQWDILKNTSLSGLREGFLQRSGKLFSKNGNIYVQVEKNSIDVLLDYLPWSLSMIRLPWMKDILRVEWR
ncbi:MAG: hypothetical protein JST75_02135 [Bacteroidetes bacterium]|nr:hypothetical protein [Bacteroidota bacterium]